MWPSTRHVSLTRAKHVLPRCKRVELFDASLPQLQRRLRVSLYRSNRTESGGEQEMEVVYPLTRFRLEGRRPHGGQIFALLLPLKEREEPSASIVSVLYVEECTKQEHGLY